MKINDYNKNVADELEDNGFVETVAARLAEPLRELHLALCQCDDQQLRVIRGLGLEGLFMLAGKANQLRRALYGNDRSIYDEDRRAMGFSRECDPELSVDDADPRIDPNVAAAYSDDADTRQQWRDVCNEVNEAGCDLFKAVQVARLDEKLRFFITQVDPQAFKQMTDATIRWGKAKRDWQKVYLALVKGGTMIKNKELGKEMCGYHWLE